VANWSRRNQCGDTPLDSVVAADITRSEYTQCADDATVVLYTIRGGGHTWPGGGPLPEAWVGPTNREIDASSLMWDFFSAHPLQRH
jgi:polyhydroxybutyrate depolymerase